MTVTASPNDIGPGSMNGTNGGRLGKGQTLLNEIAVVQTTLALSMAASPNSQALAARLNQLQIQAVDYFMGSFWVSADQILATIPIPAGGPVTTTKEITRLQGLIAIRQAQVNTLIAAGIPVSPVGNEAPQYSTGYPPPMSGYPLTLPDAVLYALQQQLVDLLMTTGIVQASTILATMTGTQTYPWNGYASNYTYYQYPVEVDSY